MATTKPKKRYWGIIGPNMPANILAQIARQQEDIGLEGTFAAQVYGPPFIPLAAAATTTERLQLGTGIAIALTRSPFETAMAAVDLDRISNGRFVLGLGTSVQAWVAGVFGMPYGKPVAHLRETIEVIRMSIAKAHTGELKTFKGKYYDLDFSELQPPGPPLRTEIPIWISALRGAMVRLGAEIGEGVIGHPIWSTHWSTTTIPEQLKVGLDRGGRERSDIHVNNWFWVTPNKDRKQSVEDARACVAFYGGVEQYEPYFAAHGFGEESKRLQEGFKRGDYQSVAHLVSDEMASTFVITGTPDEVREKLEPVWEATDSMTLLPPILSLLPEQMEAYFNTIAETFYQDL
jgi:probable F420-dependent oxidoreductase